MTDLKKEIRALIIDAYKKEGIPLPAIDKIIDPIWEKFRKSEPLALAAENALDAGWKVWSTMQRILDKYGVHKNVVPIVMTKLKKKYGENPTEQEILEMVSHTVTGPPSIGRL